MEVCNFMQKGCYDISRVIPEVRQGFLDNFDMGEYSGFVEGLVYFKGKVGNRVMSTCALPGDLTSVIRVSDLSFRTYSWHEFYSVLVLHEGLHAQQKNFERNFPNGKVIKVNFRSGNSITYSEKDVRQEIAAHRNQIEDPSFAMCSPKFQGCVNNWLNFYENFSDKYIKLID